MPRLPVRIVVDFYVDAPHEGTDEDTVCSNDYWWEERLCSWQQCCELAERLEDEHPGNCWAGKDIVKVQVQAHPADFGATWKDYW